VLVGVRQRDPQALGAFFEHYFGAVYGLAYRFLGHAQQAEDATSEVFLKIHGAAGRLDPDRDPGPWVLTITLNTCRSIWRSGSHRMARHAVRVNGSTDFRAELTDPAPDPAEEREIGERERLVQEALARLPEPLREVVLLRDYQGLSHKETSEVLKLSHDAVRKRYSRALEELAGLLQGRLG
jgi:RNA polymerase sigma factor (sigma-70 family)